jgi:hypothetical protein
LSGRRTSASPGYISLGRPVGRARCTAELQPLWVRFGRADHAASAAGLPSIADSNGARNSFGVGITSLVEVPGLCRRPLFQFVRMRQLRIGEHSFRHRGRSAMSPQALLLAVVGANALASALFATDESDWSAPPQHSFDQSWRRSIAIRQHTAARILRRKITGQ